MADYLSIPLLSLIADLNLLDEFQIEEAAGEVETKGVTAFQALFGHGISGLRQDDSSFV